MHLFILFICAPVGRIERTDSLTQSVGPIYLNKSQIDAAPSLESDLRERTILVSGASSVPQITSTYEKKSIESLLFLWISLRSVI